MKDASESGDAGVHSAAIALGANLGDAAATVAQALQGLDRLEETRLEAGSGLYRSAAVGPGAQPDYVNAAALVATRLAPLALLDALQKMESESGRERTSERWGPRTLDLDIIAYDEREITEARLTVPHPQAHHRCFVLAPLAEIAPGMSLPGYGRVAALLKDCDTGEVYRITPEEAHG